MTDLTANEAAVLLTFNTYDTAEGTKGDLGVSWTGVDVLASTTGKPMAAVKGILGSLIKKGLVESDEADKFSGKPIAQCLTEQGVDVLFALRAAKVAPLPGQVADTAAFVAAQVEPKGEPSATPVTPPTDAPAEPARARQNGILYPVAGTVAHAIWTLAQGFADANGREAKPGDLKEQAEAAGINLASLGCGMGHRRKFMGIAKQRG